ncbi:D-3-phosphoglycerate dehydrogenase [Candidatus Rhodobacter oscarellae]|uniref:D-3-phosphoglycerate dehydrogenase n=1 Tax=Candidatus Rhodobacter oscarellae TaxID=1675527 RepID=A0A0J9EAK6_9RHOB|nr:glyoxylate/hydroxypyruvate reductase A [Candidatus Rhodobacter lobularis]KMW59822.1 D-3-phosphoglycerate dehydrogenase [Candidatus Rhodobacter lobularis]
MTNILFAAGGFRWGQFEAPLRAALAEAGLQADLSLEHAPDETDYIIYAPNKHFIDFAPYGRVKLVQSLWAGVENIVTDATLTQPLARMVDEGLSEGMVEWVTGHVLRHHLGMDRHIVNPGHEWVFDPAPLARTRNVGVLGLGALGAACAQALAALNFNVLGWSRSLKAVDGVACFAGDEGLREIVSRSSILVLLLPLTGATENLLNAERLGWMPKGAVIVNPGRGPLIDDDALLAALESGQIAQATLDVFREEPLPQGHPFWAHPGVTVTPHIASETRPETASRVAAQNIARVERGEPPLYLVDRQTGY